MRVVHYFTVVLQDVDEDRRPHLEGECDGTFASILRDSLSGSQAYFIEGQFPPSKLRQAIEKYKQLGHFNSNRPLR